MTKQDELKHYGIKGMRWGVRKKIINDNRTYNDNRTINQKKYDHTSTYDRYLVKEKKRAQRASGDAANLKYMTDKERQTYAKGRIKTMGSKEKAQSSETRNFAGKMAKGTGLSLLGGGVSGVTTMGLLGSATLKASMSVAESFVVSAVGGAATGGVVAVASLSAVAIANGTRFVKNRLAIKNA